MTKAQVVEYRTASVIQNYFGISTSSLRRWSNTKLIKCLRYGQTGKRLYHFPDVERDNKKTEKILYCRVSSTHQKEDLQRQIQDLSEYYPDHIVISAGLNFKRKGLWQSHEPTATLLDKTFAGLVQEVIVLHKDRLCRYGIEILEFIFQKFGTKFVVHSQETKVDDTKDLADDLLAITTIFVARHNGRRSAANRRRRTKESGTKSDKNTTLSDQRTTNDSI